MLHYQKEKLAKRKQVIKKELKQLADSMLPGEKLKMFNNVAEKRFNDRFLELQALKSEIEQEPKDFQIALQRLNRYFEVSKELLRKVAIELIGA